MLIDREACDDPAWGMYRPARWARIRRWWAQRRVRQERAYRGRFFSTSLLAWLWLCSVLMAGLCGYILRGYVDRAMELWNVMGR